LRQILQGRQSGGLVVDVEGLLESIVLRQDFGGICRLPVSLLD
jgi:hypothetical protein